MTPSTNSEISDADEACEQAASDALDFVMTKLPGIKKEKGLVGVWMNAWRLAWTSALSRRSANTSAGGVEVKWPGRKFCEIAERNISELAKFIKGEDDKLACTDAALAIRTLLSSLHPTDGEPVAWVTADILAAMKRGERAVPGWKQSDDFCIPLYAGTRPSNPVSAEVTEAEKRIKELSDLLIRAQYNVSEVYQNWHSDARAALAALNGGRENG